MRSPLFGRSHAMCRSPRRYARPSRVRALSSGLCRQCSVLTPRMINRCIKATATRANERNSVAIRAIVAGVLTVIRIPRAAARAATTTVMAMVASSQAAAVRAVLKAAPVPVGNARAAANAVQQVANAVNVRDQANAVNVRDQENAVNVRDQENAAAADVGAAGTLKPSRATVTNPAPMAMMRGSQLRLTAMLRPRRRRHRRSR